MQVKHWSDINLKLSVYFLICFRLPFALNCSFWYVLRFLILNLLRLQDAWTACDRRTENERREKENENGQNGTPVIA